MYLVFIHMPSESYCRRLTRVFVVVLVLSILSTNQLPCVLIHLPPDMFYFQVQLHITMYFEMNLSTMFESVRLCVTIPVPVQTCAGTRQEQVCKRVPQNETVILLVRNGISTSCCEHRVTSGYMYSLSFHSQIHKINHNTHTHTHAFLKTQCLQFIP